MCVKANIFSHVFYHGDLRVKVEVSFMDESLTSDLMFFKEMVITLSFDIGSLKISQVRKSFGIFSVF